MSGPASGPELELVDDAYLAKMAAFESDCNDGKGEPMQSNPVSHGCPSARFRGVSVINATKGA